MHVGRCEITITVKSEQALRRGAEAESLPACLRLQAPLGGSELSTFYNFAKDGMLWHLSSIKGDSGRSIRGVWSILHSGKIERWSIQWFRTAAREARHLTEMGRWTRRAWIAASTNSYARLTKDLFDVACRISLPVYQKFT